MKIKFPIVRLHMSRLPTEIERCETVADALTVMDTQGIRHVPVMNGSRLMGVVSQRDLLQARIDHGDAVNNMLLENFCENNVLTASPIDTVDQVAERMLQRKVGSAVVVDGGFVVGIFTTTDALRVLRDLGNPEAKS